MAKKPAKHGQSWTKKDTQQIGILARKGVDTDDIADGQRFIMVAPVEDDDEDAAPPKIRIVQNWYEEFRAYRGM